MNKYTKMFALVGATLLLGACQEDTLVPESVVVPGNEIQFGASAHFQAGDEETRTVYGDKEVNANGTGLIEVEWLPGEDRIDIACPQAVGSTNSEYMVMENNGETNGTTADDFSSSTLTRISPVGLQWSSSATHNFYASYPSKSQLLEKLEGVVAPDYSQHFGLSLDGEAHVLRGYLPIDQKPKGWTKKGDGWVVEPDMTYAYMTAKTVHNSGDPSTIGLEFESQVTALEFQIVASDFEENVQSEEFTFLGVQLYHADGKNISGFFKYNYETNAFVYNNTQTGYEKVSSTFGEDGLVVPHTTGFVDVTLFLLPGVTFNEDNSGKLKLTVIYKVGENPMVKTATLQKEIQPKKKYYFSNVKLPVVTTATGSTWFSALNPNTLFSQVSLPIAGNVFSNTSYGVDLAHAQQTVDYETLWMRGVRGFEFVTQTHYTYNNSWGNITDTTPKEATLADQHFVCDEEVLSDSPTFGTAFTTLAGQLAANPNECLVFIMTYQASNDAYSPQRYINQLLNYLDGFVSTNTYGFTKDDFVQITNQTTVGDLKGNIGIIIRPGDDSRDDDNGAGITKNLTLTSNGGVDWSGNVMLIQDWGTAFDVWDRRYGGFARESSYKTVYGNYDSTVPEIENYLWGISDNEGSYASLHANNNAFNYLGGGADYEGTFADKATLKKLAEFNYEHAITGSAGKAYVQEWMRVAPIDETLNTVGRYAYQSARVYYLLTHIDDGYLWVRWPESYNEKKDAIKGLFNKSVATRGNTDSDDLYINVLSGYYIDWYNSGDYYKGLWPFKYEFVFYADGRYGTYDATITPEGQGKGGNHTLFSYDINKYVHGLLSATPGTAEGLTQVGPWGMVVIDHIGLTSYKKLGEATTITVKDDKSMDLVNLIMMNNFKFPMATNTVTADTGDGSGDTGDNGDYETPDTGGDKGSAD